ncbi:MAG: nitroreductase family deazaflavin-dependent oxidoreductase [Aquificales bacterium]|nr:nitroreductase family deazaflavin-dependent oxidoreductase [Aquificales bacterium]
MPDFNPNLFQRTNMKLASTRPMAKLFSYTFHRMDRPVVGWSNGRYSVTSLLTGMPLVTLTATGAKSAVARETPLIGSPAGDEVILIASNWGGKKHPS